MDCWNCKFGSWWESKESMQDLLKKGYIDRHGHRKDGLFVVCERNKQVNSIPGFRCGFTRMEDAA